MIKKIDWSDFVEKVSSYSGIEINELKYETNIYSDMGVDSLGLLSLGLFLMKTYEINLPLSSVATIETLGDIFNMMNDQQVEQGN